MNLAEKTPATLSALADDLKNKKISAVELAESCLHLVDERDPQVGAVLKVDRESVLAAAAAADERRANGRALSDFDGIPVGIKDNIAVKGEICA